MGRLLISTGENVSCPLSSLMSVSSRSTKILLFLNADLRRNSITRGDQKFPLSAGRSSGGIPGTAVVPPGKALKLFFDLR